MASRPEFKIDIARLDRERDAIGAELVAVAGNGPSSWTMSRGAQSKQARHREKQRDQMARERQAVEDLENCEEDLA